MRRLMWKIGRKIYMSARGEPTVNLPYASGEIYIQQRVARAIAASGKPATVLDVGANLGQWSLQFLEAAEATPGMKLSNLRLHSFEPVPTTRKQLISNIGAAGRTNNLKVHPYAVSDRAGKTHINILGTPTSGRNSIVDDLLDDGDTERIEIETRTVVEVCQSEDIATITLLKIDAEGHDFLVIKGASRLLEGEKVDVVQFEYTKRWIDSRTFLKDVFALVADGPYNVARLRPDRLELLPSWHAELERFFAANYALVHERALPWFDVHQGEFDRSNTYA